MHAMTTFANFDNLLGEVEVIELDEYGNVVDVIDTDLEGLGELRASFRIKKAKKPKIKLKAKVKGKASAKILSKPLPKPKVVKKPLKKPVKKPTIIAVKKPTFIKTPVAKISIPKIKTTVRPVTLGKTKTLVVTEPKALTATQSVRAFAIRKAKMPDKPIPMMSVVAEPKIKEVAVCPSIKGLAKVQEILTKQDLQRRATSEHNIIVKNKEKLNNIVNKINEIKSSCDVNKSNLAIRAACGLH